MAVRRQSVMGWVSAFFRTISVSPKRMHPKGCVFNLGCIRAAIPLLHNHTVNTGTGAIWG